MKDFKQFMEVVSEAVDSSYLPELLAETSDRTVYKFNDGKTDYAVSIMGKWQGKIIFGKRTYFVRVGKLSKSGAIGVKIGNPANMGRFIASIIASVRMFGTFNTADIIDGFVLELPTQVADRVGPLVSRVLKKRFPAFDVSTSKAELNNTKKSFLLVYAKAKGFERTFKNIIDLSKKSKHWNVEEKEQSISQELMKYSTAIDKKPLKVPMNIVGQPVDTYSQDFRPLALSKYDKPSDKNPQRISDFKAILKDNDFEETTIYKHWPGGELVEVEIPNLHVNEMDLFKDIVAGKFKGYDHEDEDETIQFIVGVAYKRKQDMKRFIFNNLEVDMKSLSWQEQATVREAIETYTGHGFKDMFNALYGVSEPSEKVYYAIESMDKTFELAGKAVKDDVYLYRGIKLTPDEWKNFKQNKYMYNPSFVSTSASIAVAGDFMMSGFYDNMKVASGLTSGTANDNITANVLFVIRGTGNVKAVVPGRFSKFDSECEFILDRGFYFKLEKILNEDSSIRVCEVSVKAHDEVVDESGKQIDYASFVAESASRGKSKMSDKLTKILKALGKDKKDEPINREKFIGYIPKKSDKKK